MMRKNPRAFAALGLPARYLFHAHVMVDDTRLERQNSSIL